MWRERHQRGQGRVEEEFRKQEVREAGEFGEFVQGREQPGGQAAAGANSLHVRAAGGAREQVQDHQVPVGVRETQPGVVAVADGDTGQDLVPEQEDEVEETEPGSGRELAHRSTPRTHDGTTVLPPSGVRPAPLPHVVRRPRPGLRSGRRVLPPPGFLPPLRPRALVLSLSSHVTTPIP